MTWNLKEEELNLISGGTRKLGLNDQPFQRKIDSHTKPASGGTDDDGPDTSGNIGQNPSDGDPDSIF